MKGVLNSTETLILIKPDAFGITSLPDIIQQTIQKFGLVIEKTKMFRVGIDREIIEQLYAEHADKDFFPSLVDFMHQGPLCALCCSSATGDAALIGRAVVAHIRALYANPNIPRENKVHASDVLQAANKELKLFF